MAGEDIAEENIVRKSEENIIGVATDSKYKQKRLRTMICALLVISILAVSVIGVAVYQKNRPQNLIAPVSENEVEMQTVGLLAGPDGAYLYRFRTTDEYETLRLYLYEYHDGKLLNKEPMEIGFTGIGSPENGEILIFPDFENYTIKIVVAADGSKLSAEKPILEGVENREYYGRSVTRIEEETKILYDTEQPLIGLLYDEGDMRKRDIHDYLSGETSVFGENDYVYFFSYEFCKE